MSPPLRTRLARLVRRRRPSRRAGPQLRRRRIRIGVGAAIVIVLATALTFLRQLPFLGGGFQFRAVFPASGQLVSGDQVRLAGLPVGTVTSVSAGARNTALVTMQLNSGAPSLREDATLAVKPRLFLEGNFYVALNPGSPSAPDLRRGATIPEAQTTVPVQFDQVLDVFDNPVRSSLRTTLSQFSTGLSGGGAGGLRSAVRALAGALPPATQVDQALQGTTPGDLAHFIGSSAAMTGQLAADPAALRGMVTDIEAVAGALAANTQALSGTVAELDRLLRAAPSALTTLSGALPSVRRLAGELRPALTAAPAPLEHTDALLRQVDGLVSPGELPALVAALGPTTARLPALESRLGTLFELVSPLSLCVSTRIVPVLNEHVPDGNLSSGSPAWLDALHAGSGLTGLSSDFDADGSAIRIGLTGGDSTVTESIPQLGKLVGTTSGGLEGVDPSWLGPDVMPPTRPDETCTGQALPDLGARRVAGSGGLTITPSSPGQGSVAAEVQELMQRLTRTGR